MSIDPLWRRFRSRLDRDGLTVSAWAGGCGWSRQHVWQAVNRANYGGATVLRAIRRYLRGAPERLRALKQEDA